MGLSRQTGLTLVELMIALAILAIIAAIAIPAYEGYIGEARIGTVMQDIRQAELILDDLALDNDLGALDGNNTAQRGVYLNLASGQLVLGDPGTAPAGAEAYLDPWGRIYRYQRPAVRTDAGGNLSNDNTLPQGYDLFSQGPDAGDAADDIIRGCNGEFVGTAGSHSC